MQMLTLLFQPVLQPKIRLMIKIQVAQMNQVELKRMMLDDLHAAYDLQIQILQANSLQRYLLKIHLKLAHCLINLENV